MCVNWAGHPLDDADRSDGAGGAGGAGGEDRAEDVLLQLSVLWRIPPGDDADARAARILDLVLDGLRTWPTGT
ncbi:hypothetical protein [Streptomyces sp. NPDC002746]